MDVEGSMPIIGLTRERGGREILSGDVRTEIGEEERDFIREGSGRVKGERSTVEKEERRESENV